MRISPLFCLLAVSFAFPGRAHDQHASPGYSREVLEKRITFFEQRLQLFPHQLNSLGRLGALYLDRAKITGLHADYRRAETTFDRLLFIDSSSKTGSIGSCYALMGQHRFSEALERARRAGERLSGDPGLWALMGDIYLSLGHYLEAETFFSRMYNFEKSLSSTTRVARMAEIRGDGNSAETLYKEAISLGEANHLPTHDLAWCRTLLGDFYMKGARLEEAETAYRKALEEEPAMHYTPWRLAILAQRHKQFALAQEWAEKAIALGPELPQYEISMGFILRDQGRAEDAEEWFQKAEKRIQVEIASGNIGHARELVKLWLKRGINLEKALELARRDLEEVRRDLEAYELTAWAMYLNGQAKEALGLVDNALRPGFGSTRALLRGGIVYYHGGEKNKARFLLEIGLRRAGQVDEALKAEAEELVARLKVSPNELAQRFLKAREELPAKKKAEREPGEQNQD